MRMAAPAESNARSFGPRDQALREARVCYDHLAGSLGVALKASMIEAGYLTASADMATFSKPGEQWLERTGIDMRALHAQRRALCRLCMDWSERRTHLAGAVGSALFQRMLGLGFLKRVDASRALIVMPQGRKFVETLAGTGRAP
jgi:hypothetical protein